MGVDDRAADSIDELDKPLRTAIDLLWDEINFHRLVKALANARNSEATTESDRLSDLIFDMDEIRRLAPIAHKQGRGPGRRKKDDGIGRLSRKVLGGHARTKVHPILAH